MRGSIVATERARAVVVGASGQVGHGVVSHLLAQDWQVTALGRAASRLAALEVRLGNPTGLETREVDPDDWPQVARELPRPSLVVASLGGWWSGPPLTRLSPADADVVIQAGLVSHLRSAQAFLPVLDADQGGTYVMLNGAAALAPVPGSGLISTVAAAQLMMARVLASETVVATVRSLVIATPVRSHGRPDGDDDWVTAQDIGAEVLRLHHDPGPDVVVLLPAAAAPGRG